MTEYLETLVATHGDLHLFDSPAGWEGKLEQAFVDWAATQDGWVFTAQAGDAGMTEKLMKDEEEGARLADFVNALPADQARVAVEGMIGLLHFADVENSEVERSLRSLL